MRSIATGFVSLALASLTLAAQSSPSYPPPFPRPNATKLLETDRIVVWNIVWPKGQPTALHRHVYDQVGTYYARGGRLITTPDGEKRTTMTEVGGLSTTKKGTLHIEEGTTDPPLQAVFIEMKKDTPSGEHETASEVPQAFPREGAKQLLDTERVTVWDYAWTPGTAASARRQTRDAVIVWMGSGQLRSTPQGGTPEITDTVVGKMVYRTRGTVVADEAIAGAPRAFVFEFK